MEQTQKRGSEKKEDEEDVVGTVAEDPPARSQIQTACKVTSRRSFSKLVVVGRRYIWEMVDV